MSNPGATLLHRFLTRVESSGSDPFLYRGEKVFSYQDFFTEVVRTAEKLADLDIGKGQMVALMLPNAPAFIRYYLAIQLTGGAALVMNPASALPEVRYMLEDSGCRHLVGMPAPAGASLKEELLPAGVSMISVSGEEDRKKTPDRSGLSRMIDKWKARLHRLHPEDRALIVYTSGTTSRPKGVVHTHRSLAAAARAVVHAWEWTEKDCLLLVLPLSHVHGLGVGLNGTIMAGASLALQKRFDPEETCAALAEGKATIFFGVPSIYIELLHAGRLERKAAERVRLFVSGSAPLPPEIFRRFKEQTGASILERYGMTETVMNLTNPVHGERRPGTVGFPFPGVVVKIAEIEKLDRGEIEEARENEAGELLVRSPSLFKHYLNNPDATTRAFVQGWFRTGDLACRDREGYYRVLGRTSVDIIKTRGFKVSAVEIEQVLQEHQAVLEAAVVGVGHDRRGEAVAAAVKVLKPSDVTEEALRDHCRARLIYYKVPDRFLFLEEIPKTGPGKYNKKELQRLFSKENE